MWPTARRAIGGIDGTKMALGDLVEEKVAVEIEIVEEKAVVEGELVELKTANAEAAGTGKAKAVAAVVEARAQACLHLQRDRQAEIVEPLYRTLRMLLVSGHVENHMIRRREVPILQADQSVTLARA